MRNKIIRWLIVPALLLSVVGVVFSDNIAAYAELYPDYGLWPLVDDLFATYGYYDGTLSSQDIIYRYENNVSMHCVEAPTVTSRIIPIATRYECFDTTAEANAYSASKP